MTTPRWSILTELSCHDNSVLMSCHAMTTPRWSILTELSCHDNSVLMSCHAMTIPRRSINMIGISKAYPLRFLFPSAESDRRAKSWRWRFVLIRRNVFAGRPRSRWAKMPSVLKCFHWWSSQTRIAFARLNVFGGPHPPPPETFLPIDLSARKKKLFHIFPPASFIFNQIYLCT